MARSSIKVWHRRVFTSVALRHRCSDMQMLHLVCAPHAAACAKVGIAGWKRQTRCNCGCAAATPPRKNVCTNACRCIRQSTVGVLLQYYPAKKAFASAGAYPAQVGIRMSTRLHCWTSCTTSHSRISTLPKMAPSIQRNKTAFCVRPSCCHSQSLGDYL